MKVPAWGARLLPLVPFFVTVLAFLPALRADFVSVDDGQMVRNNPGVLQGFGWPGLQWAFTTWYWGMWHPLTWVSHQLDVSLFGLAPWGHHLTSVLLHGLTAALAFQFFRTATGQPARSLLVALLFALHPLRAESVVWVAERKDVLCACFWVLAMLAYQRHRAAPSPARFALVTLAVALALLSKPMAVTLPFALLLLDVWPLGPTRGRRAWTARVLEKLPWLALAAGAAALTVAYQKSTGAVAPAPLGDRLPRVAAALGLDLWHTVWPVHLSYFYPRADPRAWQVALSALAVAALLAASWLTRRRAPALGVGVLWFLGVILPTTGVLQVGGQLTADRYTYLPHLGLFAGVVFALPQVSARFTRAAALGAVAVLVACLGLLWGQVAVWSSSESLYAHALERDPDNTRALQYLGMLRLQQQRVDDAVALLEAAARSNPGDGFALSNLARAYDARGDLGRALETAERAVKLPCEPNQRGLVLQAYAKALVRAGRAAEAEPVLRDAVALAPGMPVELDLARVLAAEGRGEEALQALEAGTLRFPQDFRLPLEGAELALSLGQPERARALLGRAQKLAPDDARVEALKAKLR